MANRSREENLYKLVEALRTAGENGLSVDEANTLLFGSSQNKSVAKKLLEELRSKGKVRLRMTPTGQRYISSVAT